MENTWQNSRNRFRTPRNLPPLDYQELVGFICRSLVEHPESLAVEVSDDGRAVQIDVKVAEQDLGRLIGQQGRTIEAIRTLVRAAALPQGLRVFVEVGSNSPRAEPSE